MNVHFTGIIGKTENDGGILKVDFPGDIHKSMEMLLPEQNPPRKTMENMALWSEGKEQAFSVRSPLPAMMTGFLGRCPSCKRGNLFRSFMCVVERCACCGAKMNLHCADDFPACLVIFLVSHCVVGLFVHLEPTLSWALWQHLVVWVFCILATSLALLQPVKGSVVALQWALQMHGFSEPEKEEKP